MKGFIDKNNGRWTGSWKVPPHSWNTDTLLAHIHSNQEDNVKGSLCSVNIWSISYETLWVLCEEQKWSTNNIKWEKNTKHFEPLKGSSKVYMI